MRRILLFAGAPILALAIPVMATGQGSPAESRTWAQKACADPWRPEPGSYGYLRWQANHNLDCAMAMIDERLGAVRSGAVSEDDTVRFSRDDLDELRRLILVGKDAALRIER